MNLDAYLRALPKAELHLHIEGSLEPEMMFALAQRHGQKLPFASVEDLRRAYDFNDLQSFLDLYYAGAGVLRDAEDFQALTLAYARRAAADGVVHAEIFFDPQTHTARGVPFAEVIDGIDEGLAQAEHELGLSSRLILCFLRHLPEEDAFKTWNEAQPFLDIIAGVGLDSSERGHPPGKFSRVFAAARAAGLRTVAHAGEEGPAAYITEAMDLLQVSRIDHGVRCEEDEALCARLAREQMPLTVCPLSNVRLKVFPRIEAHNLRRLLQRGLQVSVHSDDPAYFGGYLLDNLRAVAQGLQLSRAELAQLARNSISASWLGEEAKAPLLARIGELASQPAD